MRMKEKKKRKKKEVENPNRKQRNDNRKNDREFKAQQNIQKNFRKIGGTGIDNDRNTHVTNLYRK